MVMRRFGADMGIAKIHDVADHLDLPFLILPGVGRRITFRVLTCPKHYPDQEKKEGFIGCMVEELVNEDSPISLVKAPENLLRLTSTIYQGMKAELKKNNIRVDSELECMLGKAWTVEGKAWITAPIDRWVIDENTGKNNPPTTYSVRLRPDLELIK